MSGEGRRAVVIGGGVIGAACAHYLCQAGWRVTIVEKGGFGKGCSHGNCGLVVPSHVMPMAQPGAFREALGALASRGAFSIKPRLDPALWSWLWKFSRRCNDRCVIESGHAISALLKSSRSLYDDLIANEPLECEWQQRGVLFVYRDAAALDAFGQTNDLLSERFDERATRVDGQRLVELEPALRTGLAGAWHYPRDAQLRPDRLLGSWRRLLAGRGVEIREQTEAREFDYDDRSATALNTSNGQVAGDIFIVAAGAFSPQWSHALGCRIPIQPGKGYSITMPRPEKCPHHPLVFPQHHVVVTPMDSGYRLGSIMEFAGFDGSLRPSRLKLLTEAAKAYLREGPKGPVEERWFGWRPMTYDSAPIIDRSRRWPNVWIAAGHNMLGLSMAPATGKLVSELVDRRAPHVDPTPYSLTRFC